jgi:hypothetical protein
MLRRRLALVPADEPQHLLFFTKNHTPLTPNNVRRTLRAALEKAGLDGGWVSGRRGPAKTQRGSLGLGCGSREGSCVVRRRRVRLRLRSCFRHTHPSRNVSGTA